MIVRRHLLILFGLFLVHFDHICGSETDEDDISTGIEDFFKQMRQTYGELKKDKKQLEIDREKFNSEKELNRNIYESDVIHLNVGGEILATTRQTLISLPKSLFSILFNGHWEQRLHYDDQENIFLDFNPIVFRHLLDQLQLNQGEKISTPSDPSLIRSFEKMMKKLRVEHLLSISDRNILSVNVDGQLITAHLSNGLNLTNKTRIFIDYHPKIVRHFIKFNRENKSFPIDKQKFYISTDKNLNQQIIQIQINQSFTQIFDKSLKRILPRSQLKPNIKWKQNAQTIAGGNGQGNKLNQLCSPERIHVDDERQCIYIVDHGNHRVVKWKLDDSSDHGEIVAGGNGQGNRLDQLYNPTDMILDEKNKSLIICDQGNRRIIRWSLENRDGDKEILIKNIQCWGLMMNENGDLFVSDTESLAVKRWRKGEIGNRLKGTIVAGGNGQGNKRNQLHDPTYIFIDREEAVYIADRWTYRVMKWYKGASEGIVVVGGQGQGNNLNQISHPYGLIVNEIGDVYVADSDNNRVMCWPLGSKEGRVVVGGNGRGEESNQLNYARGLSLDVEHNLYVADSTNNRVQRFRVA